MAAGIIDHESGTRDMRRLSGLRRSMPYHRDARHRRRGRDGGRAAAQRLPVEGDVLRRGARGWQGLDARSDRRPGWRCSAGMFSVAYSLRFIHRRVLRPAAAPTCRASRTSRRAGCASRSRCWCSLCLVVGIVPALTVGPYLQRPRPRCSGRRRPTYSLAIWHGLNAPLLMSVVALGGGAALYVLLRQPARAPGPRGRRCSGGSRASASSSAASSRSGGSWPRALCCADVGTERLQPQLRILVLVACRGGGLDALGRRPAAAGARDATVSTRCSRWSGWSARACAVGAAWQAKFHRLAALTLLGGAGLVTCITFVWFSAPDLALTQLAVEIVTTVLILLGLRWLPEAARGDRGRRRAAPRALRRGARPRASRWPAAPGSPAISLRGDDARRAASELAAFFLEHAYAEGGGTNVVNVMLVDFRGFDTLGEITVLGDRRADASTRCCGASGRRARASELPEQQRLQRRVETDLGPRARRHAARLPAACRRCSCAGCSRRSRAARPTCSCAATTSPAAASWPGWCGGRASCCSTSSPDALGRGPAALLPLRWIGVGLLIAAATGAGSWLSAIRS